jgi:glycosyltransferase involved in cell wall biosynthesis
MEASTKMQSSKITSEARKDPITRNSRPILLKKLSMNGSLNTLDLEPRATMCNDPSTFSPLLSIIVPCLNEEENVSDILNSISKVVLQNDLNVEVLIIDDTSDDRTFDVALEQSHKFQELNVKVFRRYHSRRGYGAVLRYGMAHAVGKYIVFVSADGVDPLELIPTFLKHAEDGFGLVQCSRYLVTSDSKNLPLKFKITHFFYRSLVKILFGPELSDTTYPFRIFRRVEALALGITQNTFSVSPEIFFKLFLNGCRVLYVPHAQGNRIKGESKFRLTSEGIRYGYVLIRAWLHHKGWVLWF